jgi:hypothetical protein
MILEIDRRNISGHGGEVSWHLDEGVHIVSVMDVEGTVLAALCVEDGGVARDLFQHPFARSAVPNLFARTPVRG